MRFNINIKLIPAIFYQSKAMPYSHFAKVKGIKYGQIFSDCVQMYLGFFL